MQHSSDAQLNRDFARIVAGERSAVPLVFYALWPMVQRFCQRFLGNDHDAEDAAQRALEKVFAQATEFDPSRSVVAWVLTIALWECRTIRRQSSRRRTEPLAPDYSNEQPSPEQALEDAQLMHALKAAIVQLSEADRAVLQSVLSGDDATAKAASSAFRKQKQRALTRLKQAYRRLYDV